MPLRSHLPSPPYHSLSLPLSLKHRNHIPMSLCYDKIINSLNKFFMVLGNQGSCEALNRSCGCCGSCLEDEVQREQCESACDLATHVFCHVCALCQEGRELRRKLPHPGFNAQPVLVMIPPAEQAMGRRAWKYSSSSWKCSSCVCYCCLHIICCC